MKVKVTRFSRVEMIHYVETESGDKLEINMPDSKRCKNYNALAESPNVTSQKLLDFMKNCVGKEIEISEK